MSVHLKRAACRPAAVDPEVVAAVARILGDVERDGIDAVRRYSQELDGYAPARFRVSEDEIARAREAVPETLRRHIEFAREQIDAFARAQRATLTDLELETLPGVVLGHRHIPVRAVGAYAPGGRYPLIASSLMTTVVAKAAGVERVVACAPPAGPEGIDPAMLYAMTAAGADQVVAIGGAHGLAALAFGIEDVEPVDMIVGAGNVYVAEAKRQLSGRVGIDLHAGPTELLVIADEGADAELVAIDLLGQLEHGPTSVGWLVTTSERVGRAAIEAVERLLLDWPSGDVARRAWDDYSEVVLCDDRDEAASVADRLAAEHVEVHTADTGWYRDRLRNYGSLFLGPETTVAYGDKGIGTNHVLPTAGAARYTGGLWVGKFLKTVTYQEATREGTAQIAPTIEALCEAEHMLGHAITARIRRERAEAVGA